MGGDTFKKVFTYADPSKGLNKVYTQATGNDPIEMPKLKYKGVQIDLATLGSPTGAMMEVGGAIQQQDAIRKKEKEEEQFKEDTKADEEQFKKFKAQEATLLDGKSTDLFVPQYKTGKRNAETQALAKIFQARKDEAKSRNARPGIAQTRYGA